MTAATTIGTVMAYLLVPMRSLGQDSWKIAAALMSSYIGGSKSPIPRKKKGLTNKTMYDIFFVCVAVNYVAVSEALGTSASVVAAGVAADNVICALYFTLLFALATKIPPESVSSPKGTSVFLSK